MRLASFLVFPVCFLLLTVELCAADVWHVDTRGGAAAFSQLGTAADGSNVWVPSNHSAFLETHDPNTPLVIVIHGNWMSASESRVYGLKFQQLTQNDGNRRLLIWSWPSDRLDTGVRRDAQIKSQRAVLHSAYLTSFLRSLVPESKVSLVGFSFGAKLVCSSLQMLGTSGHSLRLRAVLLAAAVDENALAPGRQFGRALAATEGILVHVNSRDKTLKYYPLLNGLCGPEAIGYAGVGGVSSRKIRKVDVGRIIGKEHGIMESFVGLVSDRRGLSTYVFFFVQ